MREEVQQIGPLESTNDDIHSNSIDGIQDNLVPSMNSEEADELQHLLKVAAVESPLL
jgi:hypothetical protein